MLRRNELVSITRQTILEVLGHVPGGLPETIVDNITRHIQHEAPRRCEPVIDPRMTTAPVEPLETVLPRIVIDGGIPIPDGERPCYLHLDTSPRKQGEPA